MATSWVLGKISDALQPTVSSAVAGAGTFAGGAMNTVGSSINGVGEGINKSIRTYGDGAKDYGNAIMDWTKAPAPRAQTAANPLGLSNNTSGGKRAVTSPNVYRAANKPKSDASKTMMTTGKSTGTSQRSGGPVKKSEPTKKAEPAKKSPASRNTADSKPKVPVKASTASATKTKIAPSASKAVTAANPLGLTW